MRPQFPLILRTAYGPGLIHLDHILRIDAEDKYTRLLCTDGSSMVLMHNLSDLEERLACGQRIGDRIFLRTHRSCIVAMHLVDGLIGREQVKMGAHRAPVSRSAWSRMQDLLGAVHATETTPRSA